MEKLILRKTGIRRLVVPLLLALLALGGLATVTPAQAADSGSLIVKLVEGLSPDQQAAVFARDGGRESSSVPGLRLHVVFVAADLPLALQIYQSDPQVERVELNRTRQAQGVPVGFGSQWALPRIGWDRVFGTVVPAGSAKVALLDTGIDAAHPELSGVLLPGISFLDGSDGLRDPSGHGTSLAGIVAGVAYQGVNLVPVSVLNADGVGQDGDIIAGIIWAADHGADVILMGFSNPDYSQNLQDAVDYAWAKGALLVSATGNGGVTTATFPAGDRGVIGVSATDADDQLAALSNSGLDTFLAAPGANIYSTALHGDYGYLSGTSAASAFVAGAAAFLKAVDPTLANGVIVARLARSADPAGREGDPNNPALFGNGRLNLAGALADAGTDLLQPAGAAPVGNGGPFVGPYSAAAAAAQVSVNPSFGPVGTPLTLTTLGSFFSPNATVTIAYNGNTVRTCSANGSGNIDAGCTFAAPTFSPGSVTISASQPGVGALLTPFKVSGKGTPALSWGDPGGIVYGTALGGSQLNASTGVPGSYLYTPAAGTLLGAGTHTLHVDFTPSDPLSYNSATKDVSIVVAGAALTLSADPVGKVYGQADPALTYRVTGGSLVNGDTLSGALARNAGQGVGSYAILLGSLSAGSNYSISYRGANFSISAATLSIAAQALSKPYGTADPVLSYTATGFMDGDTSAILSGSLSRAAGENLGSYAIQLGSLSAGSNYLISFTGASFTIGKLTPTVSWPTASAIVSGQALSASQLSGGSASVPGRFALTSAGLVPNTGTAPQGVTFTPTDTAHYNVVTGSVSVPVSCGVPGNLVVPASSTGAVLASWTGSSSAGVSYVLEQSLNGGGWSLAYSGSASVAYFQVNAQGSYLFRVKASRANFADSPYLNSKACSVTLGPPSGLVVPITSTGAVLASWTGSSSAGVGYILEQSLNGGGWSQVYSGRACVAYFQVNAQGSYSFRVKATRANFSDSAYAGSGACSVALGPPSALVVPASSSGAVYASWTGSATGNTVTYLLEQSSDNGAHWTLAYSGSNNAANVTVSAMGSYLFRVKATRPNFSDSAYANSAACSVALGAPGNLTVPATSSGAIYLAWTGSSTAGATYLLEQNLNGVWSQVYSGSFPAVNLTATLSGSYGFRVRAVKAGFSDSATVTSATSCTVTIR
jgi:hypothetical protein